MATGMPLLRIVDLGHCYAHAGQEERVFSGLSAEVFPGELVCLIGRSGCGKSTLLKIIAGFLAPSQGRCLLDGQQLTGPGPDRGVVFQEDALFPWLTVRENIGFGLKATMAVREAITEMLTQVGLPDHGDHLPRALSGGMKQRVALARVLIRAPRILLMDEPFGALDAQSREEMQDLLLRLMAPRRQTVIFVTHDVQEAVLLADRVLLLDRNGDIPLRQLPLPLARPRDLSQPAFQECARQLHRWLRQ